MTKQMLGGLAPFLSFGVAQHEAWLKAGLSGATLDRDIPVRRASGHVTTADSAMEAVAVVHAGMLLLAALKAGIDPGDAGRMVAEVLCNVLGMTKVSDSPAADY